MPSPRLLAAAAAALCLAGCGSGGGGGERSAAPGDTAAGQKVFLDSGCGGCHTLAAANATGAVGPNLDQLKPSTDRVARQVENGGPGMPAFGKRLTKQQIDAVADFVANGSSHSLSVAAAFKPDDTKISSCEGDFHCLEQAFANLSYYRGPKTALGTFDRTMLTNKQIEADCHRIAHAIGAGALAHYKGNVGAAFAAGSASCWSGYYHGILERAFQGVPDSRVGQVARRLCAGKEVHRTQFLLYQCVHGLGHGLMIYSGYDLPKALKICDALNGEWDQVSCTGGVFMENQQSSYGFKSKWLKDDDLIYPCNVVAERHKLYCYLMVTSHILPQVDWNWAKASKICHRSDPKWVTTCFESLGRDASGQTRGDARKIVEICATGGTLARHCLFGASRDLTAQDFGPNRAAKLCRASPQDARGYCFYGIGTILGSFGVQGVSATCRRVSGAYGAACLRGARGLTYQS
jgi:mono/diheme cytochrome c family protein